MIRFGELEWSEEQPVMAYFKVLSQHLEGVTRTMKTLGQDRQCHGHNSNLAPSKHK